MSRDDADVLVVCLKQNCFQFHRHIKNLLIRSCVLSQKELRKLKTKAHCEVVEHVQTGLLLLPVVLSQNPSQMFRVVRNRSHSAPP